MPPLGSAMEDEGPARPRPNGHRVWILICLSGPAVVLASAYVLLAIAHGELRLWDVPVHESGRYTLGQTVLYFRHFLREVPTAVAISLFTTAAYGVPHPSSVVARPRRELVTYGACLGAAVALLVLSLAIVVVDRGAQDAVRNLAQFHTRDELIEYGSHWRFHFLSTLWVGLGALVAARIGARWLGGPSPEPWTANRPLTIGAWVYFLVLSVVFVPTLEPFLDPRFIGHQAREILTHAAVTLPIGFGIVALIHRRHIAPEQEPPPIPPGAPVLVAVFLIPAYLGAQVIFGDVLATGQTDHGMAALVAAHFFEHSLDYLFVGLLTAGGYGLLLASHARVPRRRGRSDS